MNESFSKFIELFKWSNLKIELLECRSFLVHFIRYPIQGMKNMPDWHWRRLISLHVFITAICGFLGGFFEKRSFLSPIFGIISSPILTFISISVATLFFYYAFQVFTQKVVSIRKLWTVILFAHIPAFILNTVAGFVPPMYLISFAFSALLLIVGFTENFQIDRKFSIKIITSVYFIFFLMWAYGRYQSIQEENRYQSTKSYEVPKVELGK